MSKLKPSPNQVTGEFRGFHYCAELYHPGSEQEPYQLLVYFYLPDNKGAVDKPIATATLIGDDLRICVDPDFQKKPLADSFNKRDTQESILIFMDEVLREKFKKAQEKTYPADSLVVFQRLSFLKPTHPASD